MVSDAPAETSPSLVLGHPLLPVPKFQPESTPPVAPASTVPPPTPGQASTPISWSPTEKVAGGGKFSLCLNNAVAGLRDEFNCFHLVWAQDDKLWYGRLIARSDHWATSALPRFGTTGSVLFPTLARAGHTLFAAWIEDQQLIVARSDNLGDTWQAPLRLAGNVSSLSIAALDPPTHIPALVVAWTDSQKNRSFLSSWQGRQWTASDFISPVSLATGTSPAQDPCVTSNRDLFCVAWRDLRAGSERIYYRYSSDYGAVWSADKPAPYRGDTVTAVIGGSPSLNLADDGTLYLAYQRGLISVLLYCRLGQDAFSQLGVLGSGAHPQVAANRYGDVAAGWERPELEPDGKRSTYIGLSVYLNRGAIYVGPNAMPEAGVALGRDQPLVSMTDRYLDIVWLDGRENATYLAHRAAILNSTGR